MNDLFQKNKHIYTNNDIIAYAIFFHGNDVFFWIAVTSSPTKFSFNGKNVITYVISPEKISTNRNWAVLRHKFVWKKNHFWKMSIQNHLNFLEVLYKKKEKIPIDIFIDEIDVDSYFFHNFLRNSPTIKKSL